MNCRGFYPWRFQTHRPWWILEDAAFEEFPFPSGIFPRWRRPASWDSFGDFDRMVTWVEKDPEPVEKTQKMAPILRKIGDKTIGDVSDDKKFAYNFDLSGFDPKDIKVKTVGQKVVVKAQTQEKGQKEDCPSVCSRQYHSSVVLPKTVNADDFKTILDNQGVLSIIAPFQEGKDAFEREVNVQREERSLEDASCNNMH